MRIISFIDQPDVIKKFLQHLGLWEQSHSPPDRDPPEKEITFDSSYSQLFKTLLNRRRRNCPALSGNRLRVDITAPYPIISISEPAILCAPGSLGRPGSKAPSRGKRASITLAIKKVHQSHVARRKAPSRIIRELVSHRKLKSTGIALRLVEVMPLNKAGRRHPHSHPGMEEVIYVQKGTGRAWVDKKTAPIRPGDAILIPPGARHMMINTGRNPLVLLCAFSAADPENHYREHPEIAYTG